jgi:hypothetical protein
MKTIQTSRNKLFYNRYRYKVSINIVGSRYLKNSRTYQDFANRVLSNRLTKPSTDLESRYRTVFDFYKKYMDNTEVTFLRYYDYLGFYTSNETIIHELLVMNLGLKVHEAIAPPDKIMYFANEPQYKYRVYLKSKRVSDSLIDSLSGFCDTYKDKNINVSNGLIKFINSEHWKRRIYSYLNNSFFIEFNDDSMITIMHLMMSECIGKTYKLEKRPES